MLQPCADQGNDSTNKSLLCEGLIEEDDATEDDHHTLHHIAHAVRHWRHALGC